MRVSANALALCGYIALAWYGCIWLYDHLMLISVCVCLERSLVRQEDTTIHKPYHIPCHADYHAIYHAIYHAMLYTMPYTMLHTMPYGNCKLHGIVAWYNVIRHVIWLVSSFIYSHTMP